MKRIFGSLRNKRSSSKLDTSPPPVYADDSPEAIIDTEVDAFCVSGGGPLNDINGGSDFVRLPAIVENAESSPNAAKAAASRIRRILSLDTPLSQSYAQHNAIMLIRILADNPGHTFARNIDAKFVATVKALLRNGKDESVQIFLRDTLEILEATRSWDEDFTELLRMWTKEKEKGRSQTYRNKGPSPSRTKDQQAFDQQTQAPYSIPQFQPPTNTLPSPDELSARISEARTSAKLLLQLIESTPPAEIQANELIKEFSDRCRTASRTVHAYIGSTDPAPDEGTLVTLIETNDELSISLSKYSHALLDSRKAFGNTNVNNNNNNNNNYNQSASSSASASASTSPARGGPAMPGPSSISYTPDLATPGIAHNNDPLLPRRDTSRSGSTSHYSASPQRTHESYNTSTASGKSPSPGVQASIDAPSSTSNGIGAHYQYNPDDFQIQNPFANYHPGENVRM